MKKTILIVAATLFSIHLAAQTGNDFLELSREVLKSEKKVAVAQAMQLSTEESDGFWTLYNTYQNEMYMVQNKRIEAIRKFSENYETLSDEAADEIWISYHKYQQELLKLKNRYYKKFKKILPAGKAARFMQVENKIETLINAQIALEMPLIETK